MLPSQSLSSPSQTSTHAGQTVASKSLQSWEPTPVSSFSSSQTPSEFKSMPSGQKPSPSWSNWPMGMSPTSMVTVSLAEAPD